MNSDRLNLEPSPLHDQRIDNRVQNLDIKLDPLLEVNRSSEVIAQVLILAGPTHVENLVAKIEIRFYGHLILVVLENEVLVGQWRL